MKGLRNQGKLNSWGISVLLLILCSPISAWADGTISGSVTDSGGNSIENACVHAQTDNCQWSSVGGSTTDSQGSCSFTVPDGTYYVDVNTEHCNGTTLAFLREWYDGADGTTDCSQAQWVTASVGQPMAINFTLSPPKPFISYVYIQHRRYEDGREFNRRLQGRR